jgi:hypothetical protein
MSRTPHQLITHLDWHPDGTLEVRYSYPFSQPHEIRAQAILVSSGNVPPDIRESLEYLRAALSTRHAVVPVRLPHQEILPKVQNGILTIVTRDQRRRLPISRLYCYETIDGISKVEREIRMQSSDFTADDRAVWDRLRQWINGKAWEDYKVKTACGIRPPRT